MNIHEYQAKAILREFGVPVPDNHVAYNCAGAREWAKRLGDGPWVVKAQIHAGGRGKGGGVKLARTADEVRLLAREMLGMTLRTHQTGPEGKLVTRVLVENGCNIARELYVSLIVDRGSSKVTVMASTEGGMDIEEVAATTPEKIFTETVDPLVGVTASCWRSTLWLLPPKTVCSVWMPNSDSTTMLFSGTPSLLTCATMTKKILTRLRLRSMTSRIYHLPAILDVWLMVRGWQWLLWILSSIMAAIRPTFWMSGAVRPQ